MAANSFTSLSLDPPLILFCVAHSSSTWPRIERAGTFAVNILGEEHEELSNLFAKKGADRFGSTPWHVGVSGAPVLEEAIAYLDCRFEAEYPGGDHKIIVGSGARPRHARRRRVRSSSSRAGTSACTRCDVTANDVALAARVVVALILLASGVGQAARGAELARDVRARVRWLRVDRAARCGRCCRSDELVLAALLLFVDAAWPS